jgi:catechol-2,3-dioxygenase
MDNGGCLAFFEEPTEPFDFKPQRDFDLHIALEVDQDTLHSMFEKGKAAGIETRGISDHGFIHSIYFRDPNGYVVELTAPAPDVKGNGFDQARAKQRLDQWNANSSKQHG